MGRSWLRWVEEKDRGSGCTGNSWNDVVCRHLGIKVERLQERMRNSVARPVATMMLSRYGGLTNRAIARMLRMSSAGTVTFQLRSAAGITDRATKATVAAIETELGRRMSEVPDE